MAFLFRLEHQEGTPVDPPELRTAVPNWRAGDTIPFPHRTLHVVAVRDEDAHQTADAGRSGHDRLSVADGRH